MKFVELKEEEFQQFLDKHPLKTFIQTTRMAKVRSYSGYRPYYLGVIKNNKIIAATMVGSIKRHFGYYEFYAPRGLLVDYEDKEVLDFFTKELKSFIKNKNGYVLRIDPYYITEEKDIDGNTVSNGINHKLGVDNLEELGYIRSDKIYQQFKYMFCLDLPKDKDELYNGFHTLPKRMIKRANSYDIKIREASIDELYILDKIINETSERKNFSARNIDYYRHLHEEFHPFNEVKFMLGEMDVVSLKNKKEAEITDLEQKLSKLENPTKKNEINDKIKKIKNEIEELNSIPTKNGKVVMSAGVFILYGNELIYLFGGNKKEYMHYGSSYLMQWTMMQYGIEHNFTKYNFYGISSPTKDDGVYNFKRGFSGYVEELIGDYELPINWYYYFNKLIHKIKK